MAKELYVGHLSESVTEEDVRKLFSVVGIVTSVHLIIDPETREFKRCGYVRMAADVDPKEAVETLDGAYLIDQTITVSIARPQKPVKTVQKGKVRKPAAGQLPKENRQASRGGRQGARTPNTGTGAADATDKGRARPASRKSRRP